MLTRNTANVIQAPERGWENNRNRRGNQRRYDEEEIPIDLRSYRYDTNNNNPAETFDRVTQEIAQYVATVQGAGYLKRALIDQQEPKLQPPLKQNSPMTPTMRINLSCMRWKRLNMTQRWRCGKKKWSLSPDDAENSRAASFLLSMLSSGNNALPI
jgi:hypothetical protein